MVQRAEALVRSLEARLHAAPAADPAAEAADKEGGEAADAAAAAAPQPAAAACEGSSAALEQPPALGALSEEYDDDYSSSGEEATPSSRPPQGLAAAFLGHKRRAASAGLEVSDVVKRTRAALRLWRQLQVRLGWGGWGGASQLRSLRRQRVLGCMHACVNLLLVLPGLF